MLDKFYEKIDYMFRRSKNADERCFDFLLRSITFFIILIFILVCWCMPVHADETYTTIGDEGMPDDVFVGSELQAWLAEQDMETSDFSTIGIASGVQSYPFALSDLPNLKIPSQLVYDGITYTPEDYYIFLTKGSVQDHGIQYLTCDIIVGQNIVIGNGGMTVYNFQNSGIGIFSCAINPNNLNQLWDGNPTYSQRGFSNGSNGFDGNITYQYYSFASPVYYTNAPFYTVILDDSIDSNVRSDFPYQYVHYPDNIFQINYHYAEDHPSEPETPDVESNKNHMCFDDVQIAISSMQNGQTLENAQFVIGLSGGDWIRNHIDEYNVEVTYEIGGKYHNQNAWNPYTYNEVMPIKTFTNGLYIKAIRDIYVGSGFASSTIYQHLYDNAKIDSSGTYKGSFPTIKGGSVVNSIGSYAVSLLQDVGNTEVGLYTLDDFYISVSVRLYATGVESPSGNFTKKFDFVRGTESVLDARGLQNENPWTGPTEEQVNPNVPSASQDGSMIQNNNQTVNIYNNNSWENHLNEVGDDNKKGTENLLDAMNNMKQVFAEVSNESDDPEQQGFIQFLGTILVNFPGIDYIVWCITIVFSLLVVIFFIKAIFM